MTTEERSSEANSGAQAPKKPKIGDTIPAEVVSAGKPAEQPAATNPSGNRRSRGGRSNGGQAKSGADGGGGSRSSSGGGSNRKAAGSENDGGDASSAGQGAGDGSGAPKRRRRRRGGGGGGGGAANRPEPVEALLTDEDGPIELDEATLKKRKGRSRRGKAIGRFQMNVHTTEAGALHVAILEGRQLIEYYAARSQDDETQIHGNIYMGRVENVLPGMEAAFVDIGTKKNAVLYRGDVQFDSDDVDQSSEPPRIEELLRSKQLVLCQVTKNPIAHKGARVTQEVSLPGRFVVLVPNSTTYGISKRLTDEERRRLRKVLDRVRPPEHGVIVRTAARGITDEEIERDLLRLLKQWDQISELAAKTTSPGLLYREPDLAARLIREEFNSEYRAVLIDNPELFQQMTDYVQSITPALAERVKYFDPAAEQLPMFERFHVYEQLRRALDEKVWLPSGGSLVIQHTEALTVIDVNTGKNVGSSSLEETVFRNNLEAADEIATQLRLRDIGGIIVIDFVDMESKDNRDKVLRAFKDALSRDKTRTQVFPISELGLVEMTRKRIGEGLLESFTDPCPDCDGRGLLVAGSVIDEGRAPAGFRVAKPAN